MKLRKNKYFILLSIVCIGLITWYTFFSGYKDWSEVNDLVEKECIVNGKAKKTCIIDFHKLDFVWDDIYYYEAGEQGGLDILLGKKNLITLSSGNTYMIFLKNKKLINVYQHYYDNWGDLIPDSNNKILLLPNWEENNETITHCKNNFILKNIKDYESTKNRIIYSLSCAKPSQ